MQTLLINGVHKWSISWLLAENIRFWEKVLVFFLYLLDQCQDINPLILIKILDLCPKLLLNNAISPVSFCGQAKTFKHAFVASNYFWYFSLFTSPQFLEYAENYATFCAWKKMCSLFKHLISQCWKSFDHFK